MSAISNWVSRERRAPGQQFSRRRLARPTRHITITYRKTDGFA
jgi:hypothetical protein